LLIVICLSITAYAQRRVPTVDDLLNVKLLGGAQISPDGNYVAYTVNQADWKQDAFVTQIWLAEVQSGKTFQLTRGEKAAGNPRWSPDGAWLAFTSNRVGDKNQLFVIRPDGGEATQLTKAENSVTGYAWSRDGQRIVFSATKNPDLINGGTADIYLYEFDGDVSKLLVAQPGPDNNPNWSPDGKQIVFSSAMGNPKFFHANSRLALVSVDG